MTRVLRKPAVKTTIALPEDTATLLQELAEQRNASYAEVVGRALVLEKFLADTQKEGRRVLVEDPRELIKQIVVFF